MQNLKKKLKKKKQNKKSLMKQKEKKEKDKKKKNIWKHYQMFNGSFIHFSKRLKKQLIKYVEIVKVREEEDKKMIQITREGILKRNEIDLFYSIYFIYHFRFYI